MSDLDILAKELVDWSAKHQAAKLALESFYEYIEQFQREEPKDFEETFPNFDKNLLQAETKNIALFLHWGNTEHSYIIARIPIIYDQIKIGSYDARFSFLGELYTTSYNYS